MGGAVFRDRALNADLRRFVLNAVDTAQLPVFHLAGELPTEPSRILERLAGKNRLPFAVEAARCVSDNVQKQQGKDGISAGKCANSDLSRPILTVSTVRREPKSSSQIATEKERARHVRRTPFVELDATEGCRWTSAPCRLPSWAAEHRKARRLRFRRR